MVDELDDSSDGVDADPTDAGYAAPPLLPPPPAPAVAPVGSTTPPPPPPVPPASPMPSTAGAMPYAPPGYAAPGYAAPPAPVPVGATTRWRSLGGLTTALVVVLVLTAVAAAVAAVAYAQRASRLGDIIDHGLTFARYHDAENADDFVGATAAILVLCSLVLLVLAIIWTWRAAKNQEALARANPRFSPGWGIAGWLIPLANLVIPVLMLQDFWRGADRDRPRGDPGWRSGRGSALVTWFWVAFVLSYLGRGFIGQTSAHYTNVSEMRGLRTHDVVAAVGGVATIVAAVLAIMVFRRIAARQEACLATQQAAWQPGAPPAGSF